VLRVSSSIPCGRNFFFEQNFLTANKAFQLHKFILYVTEDFKLFYCATPQKIIFPRPGFELRPGQCSWPPSAGKRRQQELKKEKLHFLK
jgi:hypothetical protein